MNCGHKHAEFIFTKPLIYYPPRPHVARVPLVYLAHHRVRGLLIGTDSERLVVQVFCPRGRHEKRLKRAFDRKIWAHELA
jgi:hypothetical protein